MNGVTINAQDKTVAQVVSEINASSAGVSATLEEHNDSSGSYKTIVLKKTADSESASKFSVSASGDFARVAGFGEYSTDAATTTTNFIDSGSSFVIGTDSLILQKTSDVSHSSDTSGYTIIRTAQDLANIANNLSGKYILMNDIDLSGIANWAPINGFTGELNGNGYTISNLKIDSADSNNVGLFGSLSDGAVLQNINLSNVDVKGGNNVGGLVGYAEIRGNRATVKNCTVTGSVSGTSSVGLLAGTAGMSIDLSDIFTSGSVSGQQYVGGVLGNGHSSLILDSIESNASVNGDSSVGGLIGYLTHSSRISNSTSTAIVTGNSSVGGIVGSLAGYIKESFFAGKINCADETTSGALAGIGGSIYSNYSITDSLFSVDCGTTNASGTDSYFSLTNTYSGSNSQVVYKILEANPDSQLFTNYDFSGTVIINGKTITLSGSDINSIIEQINAKTSETGVVASLDSANSLILQNADGSNKEIARETGTSMLLKVAGISEKSLQEVTYEKLEGSVDITSSMQTSGYISQNASDTETLTISTSTGSFNVEIKSGESLNSVIDKINAETGGSVTAAIENGKLVFAYGANATNVSVSSTGDFTKFYGLKDTQSTWEWTEAAGGMSQSTTSEIDPDAPTDPTDPTDPDNPGGGDPTDPDPDNPDDPPLNINNLVTEGISNIRLQVGDSSSEHCVLRCDTTFVFDDFSLDFSTAESSADCVEGLQDFQKAITAKISTIGVYTSRLEAIQSHNLVKHENLTSAYSTIVDADIAEETTKYIKNQIVQQTSQALMAQAQKVQIERVMTLIGSISGL